MCLITLQQRSQTLGHDLQVLKVVAKTGSPKRHRPTIQSQVFNDLALYESGKLYKGKIQRWSSKDTGYFACSVAIEIAREYAEGKSSNLTRKGFNRPTSFRSVGIGFHSYQLLVLPKIKAEPVITYSSDLKPLLGYDDPWQAIVEGLSTYQRRFIPCVIPKGSRIYTGIDGTLVSNQIVIDMTVEDYSALKGNIPVVTHKSKRNEKV